ncbi:MAG: hypothetical protein DRI69_10240 [Bacteroidetes bacterium]|nr:MAG: hypothetical protein DRI69_10240 [Bacteroidota bacterium]
MILVKLPESKLFEIHIPREKHTASERSMPIMAFDKNSDSVCMYLVFKDSMRISKTLYTFSEYMNQMSFSSKGQSLRIDDRAPNGIITSASVLKNNRTECTFIFNETQKMKNIHPVVFSFPELELLPSIIDCRNGNYLLNRIITDQDTLISLIHPLGNPEYRFFDPEKEIPLGVYRFLKWSTKNMVKILDVLPNRR